MITYMRGAFLLLLFHIICPIAHSEEIHVYTEFNGNRSINYTWEMIGSRDHIKILVTQDDGRYFENIYDRKSDTTIEWIHRTGTRNITATREGNEIYMQGMDEGKPVRKVLQIDKAAWYQAMTYSLRPIASGESGSIEPFWVIRSDNLEALKLRATKKETDTLEIDNMSVDANLVEVTPDNRFLAMLWRGRYWFRKDDHVFLKYKGSNGPPYTSETVVRLKHDYTDESEDILLKIKEQ